MIDFEMIDFEKALSIVESGKTRLPAEIIPVVSGSGRYMAEALTSPIDSPPFDKAAMDGFALQEGDASASFTILETIAAGSVPAYTIEKGTCAKIMTGAMMPEGAHRVLRVEYTCTEGNTMVPLQPERAHNVIRRGENLREGEVFLEPKRLTPRDIGIIASFGYEKVAVIRKPVAGIISTGTELKNPGEMLKPGEIYNSNGSQLYSQVEEAGGIPRDFGTIADEPGLLGEAISASLSECDLTILTGGVSMGDFDYVPGLLKKQGVDILFHSVAIKPGKPTLFGEKKGRYVFGLPGNPVSSYVIFELLAKPLFYRFAGLYYRPRIWKGILAGGVKRRDTERMEFLPVRQEGGKIFPVRYHGSAHLNSLSGADGLIAIPKGIQNIAEGEDIDVRPF